MTMTNEEILLHWRQSKRKPKDITILADLNQVPPETIRTLLEEQGETAPTSRRRHVKLDEELVRQLYDDGMTDEAIAEQSGVKHSPIASWRRRNNLPKHGPPPETGEPLSSPQSLSACGTVSVYEKIESVLALLANERSTEVRRVAAELLITLFENYLAERLGLEEGGGQVL